jgi:orotate phosphoribosyltransferase
MFDKQAYERFLFDTGCVGFFDPPITLKSGRPGHWYVNMRDALQTEETKYTLARFVYDFVMQEGLKPDHFLGVPDGANPLAQACNSFIDYKPRSEIPASVLRAGKKAHGDPQNRYSVGPLKSGSHGVLIEDVTTTGGSSMEQILRLQELGILIDRVVSCVSRYERRDRGRTVPDVLERDYHIKYSALTDARSLLPQAISLFNPSENLARDIEAYYEKYGITPIILQNPKINFPKLS